MARAALLEKWQRPAAAALSHPLRVRILGVLTLRTMSPNEFAKEGLGKGFPGGTPELGAVNYHFRALEAAGCLEILEERPVRGSTEHFYRASARAFHSTAEWEQLSLGQRKAITTATWQGFIAQVELALLAGTFDSRTDRHLSWVPMTVDEQGWKDLGDLYDNALVQAEKIAAESAERNAEARRPEYLPTTVAHLAFPSPPPPAAP